MKPHQARHPLVVRSGASSAQLRRNPPVAIERVFALNRLYSCDKRCVVRRIGTGVVLERAAGDLHHATSFGDGEGRGPVITDGLPSR